MPYIVQDDGTPEGGSKCLIWSDRYVLARFSSSAGLWWMLAYMYAGTGGIPGRFEYMHQQQIPDWGATDP